MATEKTPPHKRIARAEKSSAEWKMKAIERREAAEALQGQLKTASENIKEKNEELSASNKRCLDLEKQVKKLIENLELANQKIATLQENVNEFKKKASR
jgi:predicted  nucleic acid-binding Zn-ribbon protein